MAKHEDVLGVQAEADMRLPPGVDEADAHESGLGTMPFFSQHSMGVRCCLKLLLSASHAHRQCQ